MENIMRTSKRITVKTETRVTKHTHFEYEYKLEYVGYYENNVLRRISKYERKVSDVSVQGSAELRGGWYINPIYRQNPNFTKLAQLFN